MAKSVFVLHENEEVNIPVKSEKITITSHIKCYHLFANKMYLKSTLTESVTQYIQGAAVDSADVAGQDVGAASEPPDEEWIEQVNVKPPAEGC